MKESSLCERKIQDENINGSSCGREPDKTGKAKTKWYFSTYAIVIALFCIGPFALPMVWFNPRYKIVTKVIVTIVVVAITILICCLFVYLVRHLIEQIQTLTNL